MFKSLQEQIIKLFSAPLGSYVSSLSWKECSTVSKESEDHLRILRWAFPELRNIVEGKTVVDFGCGEGWQAISLAKEMNCKVVGIDSNSNTLARAISNARDVNGKSGEAIFYKELPDNIKGNIDIVISQNSFEHFSDPQGILGAMFDILKPDGHVLITFGPPWYAPHGSHMNFFCRIPWLNLIFSEEAVMNVRSLYRTDGAKRYEDVESGLNRMSVSRFEKVVEKSNMEVVWYHYEAVKGLNSLTKIPIVRELFTNHISAILRK